MRCMGVQSMHQRWPLQDNSNPRVAMTVDAALVTFGDAKPTLQIQIVVERRKRVFAHEQTGQEARHHLSHLLVDRGLAVLEAIDQGLEFLLPLGASLRARFERRGDFRDVLHVVTQRLLVRSDGAETAIDAVGQAVELRLGEPPFLASKFRWIDSRTSLNASAMRKPGGWSGPP